MDQKIMKIKQGVLKVVIFSVIMLIVCTIIITIIALFLSPNMSWGLTISFLAVFVTMGILFLLSTLCGVIFLLKNKDWKIFSSVRVKGALDWGLFYFKFSNKIEKLLDNSNTKKESIN